MQSYPSRVLRLGVEQGAKLLGFYPIDRIDSMTKQDYIILAELIRTNTDIVNYELKRLPFLNGLCAHLFRDNVGFDAIAFIRACEPCEED